MFIVPLCLTVYAAQTTPKPASKKNATATKGRATAKKGTVRKPSASQQSAGAAQAKAGNKMHAAATQGRAKPVAKSTKGKKPVKRTTWRNRQLAPSPERYKEIQGALAAKGYLPAESADGQWSDASVAALKKFQADQHLEATGKLNSLSLIALGLGPKRDTQASLTMPGAAASGAVSNE